MGTPLTPALRRCHEINLNAAFDGRTRRRSLHGGNVVRLSSRESATRTAALYCPRWSLKRLPEPTLRIAWTGSAIANAEDSGAAGLGRILLSQVLESDVEVDLYHPGNRAEVPEYFTDHPNLSVIDAAVRFEWDRWYSSNRVAAFISGSLARIVTQVRLGRQLINRHHRHPYDVIFQFSQLELLSLGRASQSLPPIVIHPCTTSARELHWHRRESRYALQAESPLQHYLVRAYLHARTRTQRRELRKPSLIAGPSEIFNRLMCEDYGVGVERTRVLRHPVDLQRFSNIARPQRDGRPIVLLFVGRFSARKGLELVTALSYRLADLAGEIQIKLLGGGSLWSDYSAHLSELNPQVAQRLGGVPATEMPKVYAAADLVLVPSHYEPGSLVAGEALAAGLPIVASDQVGPVEVIDRRVCRVFSAGSLDSLEREVRTLVAQIRGDRNAIGDLARAEAYEHFGPDRIGRDLVQILHEAAGRTRTEKATVEPGLV
jgi:glycosyltransferase involved in cell wall biosynthesis